MKAFDQRLVMTVGLVETRPKLRRTANFISLLGVESVRSARDSNRVHCSVVEEHSVNN